MSAKGINRRQQREQKLRHEAKMGALNAMEELDKGKPDYDFAHDELKEALNKCALAREAAR